MQQVIDFDNVYNIFVGEAGSDTMASATLLDLLNKRLEFFQLQDKVQHKDTHCRDTQTPLVPPPQPSPLAYCCLCCVTEWNQVSLFLLRFPPETLYDVEDLAYDAALNMDMDDLAQAAQQQQQQKRQNGQQPEVHTTTQGEEHTPVRGCKGTRAIRSVHVEGPALLFSLS